MLNVSKAKDRDAMAVAITSAMPEGWTVEERDEHDREIALRLYGPRGLSVRLTFDGGDKQQRQGTFVVSWVLRNPDELLAKHAFQSVNTYHYGKATDVCEGFDQLLWLLTRRMEQAVRGVLFQ